MSHGNRWWRTSSKVSLNTRFVCVRTSFSTNFWWNLFLLFEWIHPSIDQQCWHVDTEHMTPYFRNVGVHVTFDVSHLSPIHFSTKDTLRVSSWSLSCLEDPVVWDFGEGVLQKTGILQFFYMSGKVWTRCVKHSSIPHLWYPDIPGNGFVGKEVFTFLPWRRGQ